MLLMEGTKVCNAYIRVNFVTSNISKWTRITLAYPDFRERFEWRLTSPIEPDKLESEILMVSENRSVSMVVSSAWWYKEK